MGQFYLTLFVDLFVLNSLMYTHIKSMKIHKLHEFAICTSLQGGNEKRQEMSKLVQFTDAHFPDLNPNSYDNLNNMKLDLKLLAKCLHQGQI